MHTHLAKVMLEAWFKESTSFRVKPSARRPQYLVCHGRSLGTAVICDSPLYRELGLQKFLFFLLFIHLTLHKGLRHAQDLFGDTIRFPLVSVERLIDDQPCLEW